MAFLNQYRVGVHYHIRETVMTSCTNEIIICILRDRIVRIGEANCLLSDVRIMRRLCLFLDESRIN